jgi:hypothetical protein
MDTARGKSNEEGSGAFASGWLFGVLLTFSGASLLGCGSELGECDKKAAEELVYASNGAVATKGQALLHDSCGNAVFCHSSAANGKARHGAPKGLDFDMLPSPKRLEQVLKHRESIWEQVQSGLMPPSKLDSVIGDGKWSFDLERRPDAPSLPSLSSAEGKAALRNWLACGAPTVSETRVPSWAQPGDGVFGEGQPVAWKDLYERVLQPSCALGGCHDRATAAGGLPMRDMCQTRTALLGKGACGETNVVPGQPDSSLLVNKLDSKMPRCGSAMPPAGPLTASVLAAVRSWIEAGAEAPECL